MESTTVGFHPKEKKPAKVFLRVDDAHAEAWTQGEITEGAIGIEVYCEIIGERWDNLTKMLVVSDGEYGWKLMIEDGKAKIPHEALRGGEMLLLGVDGWDADGNLRIPTILAGACFVQKSVAGLKPKDPLPPSPDITARILAAAERALAIAADIERRADEHEFDGKDGFSPTVRVTPIEDGYKITITDAEGEHTAQLHNGTDYQLTEADKEEIARMVPGYDDTEIWDAVGKKMEKHILDYDGTHILEDGEKLTFAQLYAILMDTPDFCVLVYSNYAYHPNGVSTSQIVFSSEYPVNGYDRAHRITMLANGTVTATETESEHTSSRVNAITEANEGSTVQYPSVKGVADYVKPIKEGLTQIDNSIHSTTVIHQTFDFDGISWEKNRTINASSGALFTYQNYYASPLIPVEQGFAIEYTGLKQPDIYRCIIAYYRSDESFLSSINTRSTEAQSGVETVPDGAKYVRFVTTESLKTTFRISIDGSITELITDILDRRTTQLEEHILSVFSRKKAVFLGDSITEGMSPEYVSGHTAPSQMHNHGDKIYWEVCSDNLSLSECIGYGVTGTTIKGGTGTSGLPFVDRFDGMDSDADLVCVFGGTNDFGLSSTIGAPSDIPDKTNSFYSALKYLIIGLKKKYPTARIIFCTPLPRFEIGTVSSLSGLTSARREKLMKVLENGKYYYYDIQQAGWVEDTAYNTALSDGTATETESDEYDHSYLIGKIKNNRGHALKEYVDAIKATCDAYSIPVCDFSAISQLYPYTRKSRYDNCGDGLHPHSGQHKIMGRLLAKAINEMC